jgi:integrase/recombinase XerD
MTENLGCVVDRFLAHKRTLGRKYLSEQAELRLLVRFAEQHHADRLDQLTAGLLDDFFASRPRSRPGSFNHLLGVVRGLLDWAVTYELLNASPLRTRRRRATIARIPFVFDVAAARRLLDAAAALPDNARARHRGPTYRAIFALCYGLGLRAGEACGLRVGDVDPRRDLLVVRGGKFGKTRLVPHGPRIGELITEQLARRRADGALDADMPLFSFDGRRCVHPGTASQVFHHLVTTLEFTVPEGVSPPRLHESQTLLRGRVPAALVSRRAGPLGPAAPPGDLPRPRRPRLHGGLSHGHTRVAGRGQPAIRSLHRTGMAGGRAMTSTPPLGQLLQSFFVDHLITVKGLRPASVRSYRDTIRLLLLFAAADKGCKITRLSTSDLTFDRVVGFLRHLEEDRGNRTRTRNQRLAAVHTLFDYIATRDPEMLGVCQRVAAIPAKRSAPPETRFLERDEIERLLHHLPSEGRLALRDRALLLFLYNTGARVQEVADLRVEHLDLGAHPLVRLHGKGDKWRTCPLWHQTARLLHDLLDSAALPPTPQAPIFCAQGRPLTRFGIYKIVRRHASTLDNPQINRRISPHTFRHSCAVHLLEAGVEVNVIRGWLGHADLSTTNRYAEINTKTKLAALRACEPPITSEGPRSTPIWRSDQTLLNWLDSL